MAWRTPLTNKLVPPGDMIAGIATVADLPVPPSSASAQGGLADGLSSTSGSFFSAPFFLDRERRVAASAAAASFRFCAAAAAATAASCAVRFAAASFEGLRTGATRTGATGTHRENGDARVRWRRDWCV